MKANYKYKPPPKERADPPNPPMKTMANQLTLQEVLWKLKENYPRSAGQLFMFVIIYGYPRGRQLLQTLYTRQGWWDILDRLKKADIDPDHVHRGRLN